MQYNERLKTIGEYILNKGDRIMELKDFEQSFIYTVKIAIDDDNYIVLREPTVLEMKDYSDDVQKNVEILRNIFDKCIIEHTFTKDGKPASTKEVMEILNKSVFLFNEILNGWISHIPLTKRLRGK